MVAGIDLAGTVVESRVAEWRPGDKVVANGFGCLRLSGAVTHGTRG
jgi:NADPH:quinone reductase-like Zn-dependent oxidoreductase